MNKVLAAVNMMHIEELSGEEVKEGMIAEWFVMNLPEEADD